MRAEPELKALMLAGLDGDAAAYRDLLREVQARLTVFYGRRMGFESAAVEDLVQETLIAIHTKRAAFDPGQPFTPWLYAIARYKLIDHYRRQGRRIVVTLDGLDEGSDAALRVAGETEASDARRDIDRGLAGLPPQTERLVREVKLEERSIADVASRTGMSEGAVKTAVHRGFLRLAARLRAADATGEAHDG